MVRDLKKGSKGSDVTGLQSWMNKRGFDCGKPDGWFWIQTEKGVKAFQRKVKIKEDGIVGEITRDKIAKYDKKVTPKPTNKSKPKTPRWLALEKALGRQFDNAVEMQEAFRAHNDYEYYYNDKKAPNTALYDLSKVGGKGVNCVDVSQLVAPVLIDMGHKNVNLCHGTFNCGGHVWVTYDADNKVFDAAGMMKYQYKIGQYMCSGNPKNVSLNPGWLKIDDAQ